MRMTLAYVILAAAVSALLLNAGRFFEYRELIASGTQVLGEVVQQDCQNHDSFVYRFEASGQSFQNRGLTGAIKPCSALRPGDRVNVYYLPREPSVSTSANPRDLLQNEEESVALAALVVPALVLWSVGRWRRKDGA